MSYVLEGVDWNEETLGKGVLYIRHIILRLHKRCWDHLQFYSNEQPFLMYLTTCLNYDLIKYYLVCNGL